jgi:hypothetical protein
MWEAKSKDGRMRVQGHPGNKISESISQKKKKQARDGSECL